MMKKLISFTLFLIMIVTVFFTGCGRIQVKSVVLSMHEMELQLNDNFNLVATVKPEDAAEPMIYWESSDSNVVTVKSGVMKAVGEGEAVVKAFTSNGTYDECKILVRKVDITEINVNKKIFTLMVGSEETLEFSVTPRDVSKNVVEWESSNSSIATVDRGVVTAKSAGKCDIIAIAPSGVKSVSHLTVKVKPKGVVINKKSATLSTGKTIKLKADVYPKTTAYKEIIWESSNDKIATVDSTGLVSAHKAGSCKIYATSYNEMYDYCKITVTQADLNFSGTGNSTINDINLNKGVYAITMTHSGSGVFKVIGSDGDGGAYTYASVIGEYKGTNLFAKGKSDGIDGASMTIAATGDWTVKIKVIEYNGTDKISGEGDCVTPMFKGTNLKKSVQMQNKGTGDFTLFLFDQSGKQIGVLCDEIDDYKGSVMVTLDKNKSYFLVAKSGGKWQVDFGNDSKTTTVKSTN
ncbi:MAG: Ig domain-containing protein [Oscillospiraceae bacterium]|nr:Ig domain-containing protein [Oscillospiraceae bacterium]